MNWHAGQDLISLLSGPCSLALAADGSRSVLRLLLRELGSTASPLTPPSFAGHLLARSERALWDIVRR